MRPSPPSRRAGQALIEFAVAALPFFLTVYGSVAVALHALEQQVAVNAAARGAREAVMASADLVNPDLARVNPVVRETFANAMFGSTVTYEPPRIPCPRDGPDGTVYVCTTVDAEDNVTVAIRGRPAGLLPGFVWQMDEEVTGHLLRFQR